MGREPEKSARAQEGQADMNRERKDPRKEFGKAVSEIARNNEHVVILSADSGKSSGFTEFAQQHADRYFEFGIMEQCAVGVASGLAAIGEIPVFCAIAPFVTCRPFEMFRNDLGYMRQNAKIVGRNGGMTYSDLGSTHHSLEDFALMKLIPGTVVLAPQDPGEIRGAVKAMIAHKGPVYMRIGNEPIPELWVEKEFVIGKSSVICEGNDLTIISTGTITAYVIDAAKELEQRGISTQVIGMPTIVPADKETVIQAAKKTGRIMVAEEHYGHGGLGSTVSEICAENCPIPVKMHGLPNDYVTSGTYEELLAYYGLDTKGIIAAALEFVKEHKKGA